MTSPFTHLLITALFLFACLPCAFAAEAGPSLRYTPVVRAVKAAAPAVVNINTTRTQRTFFGRQRMSQGAGSGVIIDGHKALVLTNAHVVDGASQITVRLLDNREFNAKLIGSDPDFDLAVLKLQNGTNLPDIALGNSSDILIGEPVISIGNPYGYSHTVTTGVISALHRTLNTKQGVFTDFIQTDAAINPGNSGGPLLNILGELIGINTAIYAEGEGIGFAIPINKAKRVLDELLTTGEVMPIWLGLYGQDMDQPTAAALGLPHVAGMLITEIVPSTPAAVGKLRPSDVILSVNGLGVSDKNHYLALMRNYTRADVIKLIFFRKGNNYSVSLRPMPLDSATVQLLAARRWGITLSLPHDQKNRGVLVQSVAPGSPADNLGLKPGDILHGIGNIQTKNLSQYATAFTRHRMQLRLLLTVERERRLHHVRMSL